MRYLPMIHLKEALKPNMKYLVAVFPEFLLEYYLLFSGFIKLNDPLGFSFKLEEYFSQGVLDFPFLVPYALAFHYL